MKNFILGILTVLVVGAVAYGAYYLGSQSKKPPVAPSGTPTISVQEASSVPAATLTPEPTVKKLSDAEEIRAALFKKNNWQPDMELNVSVSNNDGTYASGTVSSQGGGGYFFAEKVGGKWEIVADGNGIIPCKGLEKYPNYPTKLIPECYDEASGNIVKR